MFDKQRKKRYSVYYMDAQSPTIQPHHHRHFRLGLGIGVVVIIATFVIWKFWPTKTPMTPTENTTKGVVAQTIVAPQSFTDFVGEVTSITPSTKHIAVVVGLPNESGTVEAKTYDIVIGTTTALKRETFTNAGHTLKASTFSALTVGQRVHVFSEKNLYPLNSFTPTTIYLLTQ